MTREEMELMFWNNYEGDGWEPTGDMVSKILDFAEMYHYEMLNNSDIDYFEEEY